MPPEEYDGGADVTIESLRWSYQRGVEQQQKLTIDGRDILVTPNKPVLTDLEEFGDKPRRIKEDRSFTEAVGFASYLKRFADDNTILFGSLQRFTVTAELDYHGKDKPSWNTHSATLASVRTAEWAAFRTANGKWFSQTEMAEFLEMWNHVVIEPDAASIVEVALNLQGSVNGTFAASVNRNNGSYTFNYQEETTTNQVRVPTSIHVSLAPFHSSKLTDIEVLFRYRIRDGKPVFQLALKNPARVEMEAFDDLVHAVESATGREVLLVP